MMDIVIRTALQEGTKRNLTGQGRRPSIQGTVGESRKQTGEKATEKERMITSIDLIGRHHIIGETRTMSITEGTDTRAPAESVLTRGNTAALQDGTAGNFLTTKTGITGSIVLIRRSRHRVKEARH
jgi:hypothetical protein